MEIAISAGETSGDALAAALVRAFLNQNPSAHFFGIGGAEMKKAGVEIIAPMEALSVMGYKDALFNLPKILKIRKRLLKEIFKRKPAAFVGVDAPDFNLRIAKTLKQKGFKTAHFVSPSVWAWRQNRVFSIAESVDEVWALFPFEPKIYEKASLPCRFVGHPLADKIPLNVDSAAARRALGFAENTPLFAFLPGSRKSEVLRHADLFIQTAKLLAQKIAGAQFVVPLPNENLSKIFADTLAKNKNACDFLIINNAGEALAACDLALVASGTATLETALYQKPMVITYKLPPLTFWLAKKMVKTQWVGLPNVLCGEEIVPEILQNAATPENLAQSLFSFYNNKEKRQKVAQAFLTLHKTLKQNAAQNAAVFLQNLLKSL